MKIKLKAMDGFQMDKACVYEVVSGLVLLSFWSPVRAKKRGIWMMQPGDRVSTEVFGDVANIVDLRKSSRSIPGSVKESIGRLKPEEIAAWSKRLAWRLSIENEETKSRLIACYDLLKGSLNEQIKEVTRSGWYNFAGVHRETFQRTIKRNPGLKELIEGRSYEKRVVPKEASKR